MAFSSTVKSEIRASKSNITLKNSDEWGARFIGFANKALHTKRSASLMVTDCKCIKVMLKYFFLEIRPSLDWRWFFFSVPASDVFLRTFNCQKHRDPCIQPHSMEKCWWKVQLIHSDGSWCTWTDSKNVSDSKNWVPFWFLVYISYS